MRAAVISPKAPREGLARVFSFFRIPAQTRSVGACSMPAHVWRPTTPLHITKRPGAQILLLEGLLLLPRPAVADTAEACSTMVERLLWSTIHLRGTQREAGSALPLGARFAALSARLTG